jgi:zinc D-Ala-D-Ala carboxypeptidase
MLHFTLSEFDSPDLPRSGSFMNPEFLALLDKARAEAGIPFKITSGFRTPEYHKDLTRRGYKTARNSAHLKGLAADIAVTSSKNRLIIIEALLFVGFRRLGIGMGGFIHVDLDPTKAQDIAWTY